jgi:ribA/ribD-fused uncharacterized protein
METDKYVLFFGHKPNANGLHIFSQWHPCTFTENIGGLDITYNNTEQYMMAHKALLFGDGQIYQLIMEATDPQQIKALGRKVKNFNPSVWDAHKFDIVLNGNRLKFGQNQLLRQRLLQTGNKKIVEASPYDKIWGIGLNAQTAIQTPENKWPGQNLLGEALMQVRVELS